MASSIIHTLQAPSPKNTLEKIQVITPSPQGIGKDSGSIAQAQEKKLSAYNSQELPFFQSQESLDRFLYDCIDKHRHLFSRDLTTIEIAMLKLDLEISVQDKSEYPQIASKIAPRAKLLDFPLIEQKSPQLEEVKDKPREDKACSVKKQEDHLPVQLGERTLELACEKGDLERVLSLIKDYNIDPSINQNFPIRIAARKGDLDLVEYLLKDPRVDPSDDDNYAIKWAARKGHIKVVKLLLSSSKVDPSAKGSCALIWSAKRDHAEVVDCLLRHPKVDPSVGENYTIKWASSSGHFPIVQRLLQDSRVDPSAEGNFALLWAVENRHAEVVDCLLGHPKVDPSAGDNYAIKFAAKTGWVSMVQHLLQDPRVDPSADSNFAMRIAAHNKHQEIVDLLKKEIAQRAKKR